jgi:hypothetical protein
MEEHDEHTVDVRITYKTLKGDTVIDVAERNIDESKEPPTETSGFLDEMKAEADPRTDR